MFRQRGLTRKVPSTFSEAMTPLEILSMMISAVFKKTWPIYDQPLIPQERGSRRRTSSTRSPVLADASEKQSMSLSRANCAPSSQDTSLRSSMSAVGHPRSSSGLRATSKAKEAPLFPTSMTTSSAEAFWWMSSSQPRRYLNESRLGWPAARARGGGMRCAGEQRELARSILGGGVGGWVCTT